MCIYLKSNDDCGVTMPRRKCLGKCADYAIEDEMYGEATLVQIERLEEIDKESNLKSKLAEILPHLEKDEDVGYRIASDIKQKLLRESQMEYEAYEISIILETLLELLY